MVGVEGNAGGGVQSNCPMEDGEGTDVDTQENPLVGAQTLLLTFLQPWEDPTSGGAYHFLLVPRQSGFLVYAVLELMNFSPISLSPD